MGGIHRVIKNTCQTVLFPFGDALYDDKSVIYSVSGLGESLWWRDIGLNLITY